MAEQQTLSPYVEGYPRPPFNPESFEYGDAVVTIAANALRDNIEELAASADPSVVVQIKTNPRGATSPVTEHDQKTERLIDAFYAGTSVRVKGEEQTGNWPEGKASALDHHVDPIDGTELFITYVKELIAWKQLPEAKRLHALFAGQWCRMAPCDLAVMYPYGAQLPHHL